MRCPRIFMRNTATVDIASLKEHHQPLDPSDIFKVLNGLSSMTDQQSARAGQIAQLRKHANITYFRSGVFNQTDWMGVKTAKCPMDMWVYQELMVRLKTDLVIETGTWMGGSALFFAHIMDIMGRGEVVTVDIEPQADLPQHSRLHYLTGSSTDPAILETIAKKCSGFESVLVILDSDHRADHKLAELRAYSELVSPGSYLIAEDTCFDYFPAWPEFGPGPSRAVRQFLAETSEFVADRNQERHMLTFCPEGFLRRK